MDSVYDYVVLGAGIYGLYLAHSLSKKFPSKKILILEHDSHSFSRASFINQARVHNGYHYPRSLLQLSTVLSTIKDFVKNLILLLTISLKRFIQSLVSFHMLMLVILKNFVPQLM